MRRLGHFLFVRHRHNWAQLIRFGIVGGSGALVNMLVVVILKRLGPSYRDVFADLPFTDFNVRWYHV
ncbi:MAG TPA: GtrA family protein, partial [Microlunatus sp.]